MFKFGILICLATVLAGEGLVLCAFEKSVYKIYKNGNPACLATAISQEKPPKQSKLFVTAAHCVRGVPPSGLIIKKKKDNGEEVAGNVSRVILHPYYKPPNVNYDIALLKIVGDSEESLSPSENSPVPNDSLKAVMSNFTDATATAIGLRECQTRLGNSIKLSSKMLCASVKDAMDGSPLVKSQAKENNNQICGVAFFSAQNIRVFTNIANSEISSFLKDHL